MQQTSMLIGEHQLSCLHLQPIIN